jgi:hypothetical protein
MGLCVKKQFGTDAGTLDGIQFSNADNKGF